MDELEKSIEKSGEFEIIPQTNPQIKEERLVAFLDIMGFKDMVARQFSTIENKLSCLSKFISETIRENEGYQYLIFSDSIIIYVSAGIDGAFCSLLEKVGKIVEKSISLGLPIKGAIAKGECTVCMDTKPFFLVSQLLMLIYWRKVLFFMVLFCIIPLKNWQRKRLQITNLSLIIKFL